MPKINIELPESLPFSTEIPLYLSHMNQAGHLDNALLLSVVSEARDRFFHSIGYKQMDVEGLGVVVADTALQYKSEAFHGEVMLVSMMAADFGRCGFDLIWRLDEVKAGREVARGKTGIVFFDYSARRVAKMPDNFPLRAGFGSRSCSQPPD